MKQKAFFIIFKGLSVAKNCLRPESVPLNKLIDIVAEIVLKLVISKMTKILIG